MKKTYLIPSCLLALTLVASSCGGNQTPSSSASVAPTGETSATTSASSTTQPPLNLEIVEQPKSTEIPLGSPTSFEVKVNDESLVKSYQWQILNTEVEEEPIEKSSFSLAKPATVRQWWVDLDCPSARTNKLVIPGPSFHLEKDYRCIITDINDNVLTSENCHYTLKNYKESDPYVGVGSRVVAAGQTLDLTTTPFGSGKVSLNEKGDELTLDNVNFSNQVFDYDPFDGDIAIYFYCYKYLNDSFTVKLIGENFINNSYYEADVKAGGITLGFFFSGRGNQPAVVFQGDGSLTTTGGSHAIYCNTDLVINNNITMHGITNHWNSGIHGNTVKITGNIRINADLTSYLFESNEKETPLDGIVEISDGVVVNARITPVQDGTHGSALAALSVISSSHNIEVKNSTVNLDLVYDSMNLEDGTLLPPSTMFNTSNFGDLTIENSDVTVKMKSIGEADELFGMQINTTAVGGLLKINNSNLTVIGNLPHVDKVYGPLAAEISAENSKITVDLLALYVNCFSSKGDINLKGVTMNINGNGTDSDVIPMGIVANGNAAEGTLTIDNSLENYIHVKMNNGIALGTLIGKGNEEREFDPTYIPKALFLNTDSIKMPNTYHPISITSIKGVSKNYQYFETVYANQAAPTVALEIVYAN